ncbi:acyltransferase family protein [Mycolicibacterium sp.]|uniref:acyltransferase family protein n=1 Tax=Mycolicibacterium sp. TaxID=2320850 RepID=UPI003D0E56CF
MIESRGHVDAGDRPASTDHPVPGPILSDPAIRTTLAGLAGVAVALVVVSDVWLGRASAGLYVLLVLAGFFIGARLLPTTSVRDDLARLAGRLLPALVVVVAASAVLTVWLQPRTRWETFADQALSTFAFIQNWQLAQSAGPYAPAGEAVSPLQHLWVVSVLGQIVLALVLVAGLIAVLLPQRFRRPALVGVVVAATTASFGYAVVLDRDDQVLAYYDTLARAWQPLAGVLAAALVGHLRWLRTGAVRLGPNRVLGARPLVVLGTAAYAVYLWHWPLLIFWLAWSEEESPGLTAGLMIMAGSVGLGLLTSRLVERPLRGGGRPSSGIPAVALGTVLVLLVVVVTAGSVGWRQYTNTIRANGADLLNLSPIEYPGARALVEGLRVPKLPMRPSVLEAADDLPATILDGCISDFGTSAVTKCVYGDPKAERTIALAGGSHSEHWLAALSKVGQRHGFRVATYLKMGCPLTTDELPRVSVSNDPYPGCREWIDSAMADLMADRPDFVLTTTTRPRTDAPGDYVPDSYLGIWDAFAANDIAIVGVRDTPWMYHDGMLFSPVDCLAEGGDPDTCGLPRSEVLADYNPTLDYLDRYPGLLPIDLSDAICRPDFCRAVEGNVLVYHDAHHLSASYVRTMTDELARQLADATHWW